MWSDRCIHKGCQGTVTGEGVEVDVFEATQAVSCDWCGAEWTLVFALTERILVAEGTGPRRECDACDGGGLEPQGDYDCRVCGGLGHVPDGLFSDRYWDERTA